MYGSMQPWPLPGGRELARGGGALTRPHGGHPGAWPLPSPPRPLAPAAPSIHGLTSAQWGREGLRQGLSVKRTPSGTPGRGSGCAVTTLWPQEEPLRSPFCKAAPISPRGPRPDHQVPGHEGSKGDHRDPQGKQGPITQQAEHPPCQDFSFRDRAGTGGTGLCALSIFGGKTTLLPQHQVSVPPGPLHQLLSAQAPRPSRKRHLLQEALPGYLWATSHQGPLHYPPKHVCPSITYVFAVCLVLVTPHQGRTGGRRVGCTSASGSVPARAAPGYSPALRHPFSVSSLWK